MRYKQTGRPPLLVPHWKTRPADQAHSQAPPFLDGVLRPPARDDKSGRSRGQGQLSEMTVYSPAESSRLCRILHGERSSCLTHAIDAAKCLGTPGLDRYHANAAWLVTDKESHRRWILPSDVVERACRLHRRNSIPRRWPGHCELLVSRELEPLPMMRGAF